MSKELIFFPLAFNVIFKQKIMKKWILTLIFVCFSVITEHTQANLLKNTKNFTKKADFRTALSFILKHEGYYVNHPDDRGKETYGGISRKYNPNWWGWRYIDSYKKENGPIKWNTRFPELDFWVLDYYLDIWVKEGFYNINNQKTANYVLDFRINGTIGAKLTNRTLRNMGWYTTKENKIDSSTIYAINRINQKLFLEHLKKARIKFYTQIVVKDSTQKQFLNHWIERSKSISYE